MTSDTKRSCLAIVLAAGEGTRMRSSRTKVLHEVGGRSMLGHVLTAVRAAGATAVAVVVGPGRDDVAREVLRHAPDAALFTQGERLGTAHAVLAATAELEKGYDDVIVAFADTPLITTHTFASLREPLATGTSVVALGFEAVDPTGYGRFVTTDGNLTRIVEHKDASESERCISVCNAGLMAFQGKTALKMLRMIGNNNTQKEFYLTDLAEVAHGSGGHAAALIAPEDEVQGVNDRRQLSVAENVFQNRKRHEAMMSGVTLIDPGSVYFSADTTLARDVLVEPNVVFGRGVSVEEGAVIHAFSHLEGCHVGAGANVGPFARLRPGADLGAGAKVGNFVEIKAAKLGAGAKVSHLTYLGDAEVGAGANIGAGTITCNYDGFLKYKTIIGAGAFVGSNSSLVAPVIIGAGAIIGAGSVITGDVKPDSLAVARSKPMMREGWAVSFRARQTAKKATKTKD